MSVNVAITGNCGKIEAYSGYWKVEIACIRGKEDRPTGWLTCWIKQNNRNEMPCKVGDYLKLFGYMSYSESKRDDGSFYRNYSVNIEAFKVYEKQKNIDGIGE